MRDGPSPWLRWAGMILAVLGVGGSVRVVLETPYPPSECLRRLSARTGWLLPGSRPLHGLVTADCVRVRCAGGGAGGAWLTAQLATDDQPGTMLIGQVGRDRWRQRVVRVLLAALELCVLVVLAVSAYLLANANLAAIPLLGVSAVWAGLVGWSIATSQRRLRAEIFTLMPIVAEALDATVTFHPGRLEAVALLRPESRVPLITPDASTPPRGRGPLREAGRFRRLRV